ncbi:MAG TPA: nucleoside transporter C-terminal domain-containing protein [Candidatus Krumholzibacteria bacterium]|nr:nucleoside transporter C-terminal domain-containing protein [Candidatus Krumholzibacteria bacterium]HPD73130.1 nucleoside transporter C-terminal domain-containing protein [Candidatus Krumholzibacteria bacterium]HRY41992.1 nucleoside transporter C-terminal domain-containing protein [Candidatus Krumholzibacteria bacterium]
MNAGNLVAACGLVILVALAWLMSLDRRRFPWRTVLWGLALQLGFALLLLRTPWGQRAFGWANAAVNRLLSFTDAGSAFLWGGLFRTSEDLVANLEPGGGLSWWQATDAATGALVPLGTIFVIHVLPTIVFFSSLMAILYHLGVMQRVIRAMAWAMRRTMGTSGAESLSTAADIFVGQTEAPLVIRPYIASITNSELMACMTAGFATIAGGVMVAYVRFGLDAGHLVAASVMAAPAALLTAKIMYPQTEAAPTAGGARLDIPREHANLLDAAAGGATVGLRLAANVAVMLLVFIGLVAMINYALGWIGTSLAEIFGWIFAPLAWCLGVPWHEARIVGNLLGTKIAVNEFVAYVQMMDVVHAGGLGPRSTVIATYALCGFANFGSIGIQIGGIAAIAPERRADVARLGLRAMFAGTIATLMTAAVAGFLTR